VKTLDAFSFLSWPANAGHPGGDVRGIRIGIVFAISAFLANCLSAGAPADANSAEPSDRTVLCFDRLLGNTGRTNITPVTVRVEGVAELTFLGEQETCLVRYLTDDSPEKITLRFPYPYDPPLKTRYWQTTSVTVIARRGHVTTLQLCTRLQNRNDPQWVKTGWHRMWALSPPESRKACDPSQ
jgi:hypothetical protein